MAEKTTEKNGKLYPHIMLMNKNMGITDTITELQRKDFPLIIERTLAETNPLYSVPEIWNKDKLKQYWKNSAVSFTASPSFATFVIPHVPTSSCHRRPS